MKNIKNMLFAGLFFLLASCAVFQGKSTPKEYAHDAGITTEIKAAYVKSDMVSAPNIHVETQKGIVQLSGFVSSKAQVSEAERIAYTVRGVRSVINTIVVMPEKKHHGHKRHYQHEAK